MARYSFRVSNSDTFTDEVGKGETMSANRHSNLMANYQKPASSRLVLRIGHSTSLSTKNCASWLVFGHQRRCQSCRCTLTKMRK